MAPPIPDDPDLVELFAAERPALVHAQLQAWCPKLLKRIGARPFSESMRASFLPVISAGVSENLPRTLLYRRALAMVASLDTSDDDGGGDSSKPATAKAAVNGDAAGAREPSRREQIEALLAKADQFTRVYDVKNLLVQHTTIIDGRKVVRSLERPFFYEPYAESGGWRMRASPRPAHKGHGAGVGAAGARSGPG